MAPPSRPQPRDLLHAAARLDQALQDTAFASTFARCEVDFVKRSSIVRIEMSLDGTKALTRHLNPETGDTDETE